MIIENLYDSHVHWMGTGEYLSQLKLHDLKKPEDVGRLDITSQHHRGQWILGFGWDQNKFADKKYPTKEILDRYFPNNPVCFERVDGHAIWVNSMALSEAGIESSDGILFELDMSPIYRSIPKITEYEAKRFLIEGCKVFNRAGFTYIRDMSCSEAQWNATCELDEADKLTVGVLQTFSATNPDSFERALMLAMRAKKQKLKYVKPESVKVYYDGALGSEGALLSQDYQARPSHRGFRIMETARLKEILIKTWEQDLDLAIHAIGDQAAEEIVTTACKLWDNGKKGRLHLEHAQLIADSTIKKMQGRDIVCHLQPCHWLSDKAWLKDKLGPLFAAAFPWGALEKAGVPFDFGSDSPIERASLNDNVRAVKDASENGVMAPTKAVSQYQQMSAPWVPACKSEFDAYIVKSTTFNGKVVYQA